MKEIKDNTTGGCLGIACVIFGIIFLLYKGYFFDVLFWILIIILIVGLTVKFTDILTLKAEKKQELKKRNQLNQLVENIKKSEKSREPERIRETNQAYKKITSNNESYKYLKNFAKKYGNTDDPEILDKLIKLINNKNDISLTRTETIELIEEVIKLQDYNDFKKKMITNQPKELENYINNFIELYGFQNREEYLDFLKTLLKEKELPFGDKVLDYKIEQRCEELELNHFEQKLNSDDIETISIDDIDIITGYEFEHFLKELFEKMGYAVENTKLSGDQGADLIVSKFGEKIAIQAKRFSDKVNNKAIQEVVASIKHYQADRGMVVTNSDFTNSAIQLAESNNIELIDRDRLEKFIERYF